MNWKIIWRSLRKQDMQKRILAVLGILIVYRILAYIPVPFSDPATLRQVLENLFNSNTSQLLSFVNVLGGGAMANISIMMAGLGPYINASVIMQLLTKAIPQLEALQKEGEYGQRKINQYTRILTLPLAIIQSIGLIYLIRQVAQSAGGIGDITANASILQWALMVAALTGGSMLLMWLGELVTEQGLGNGISLLITVGIVSRLPQTVLQFGEALGLSLDPKHGTLAQLTQLLHDVGAAFASSSARAKLFSHPLPVDWRSLLFGLGMLVAVLLVIVAVVKLNEASRNIIVNYAKRVQGNRAYGGITTVLPVKLITAGVIPIIFAVAFLNVPSFAGQLMLSSQDARLQQIGTALATWFQPPSATISSLGGFVPYVYPVCYFLLVFIFTFFYTSITFNAKEIAENLQKQGGFVEGVRSGAQTGRYLSAVVNRLTFFGAISLGLLALLPIVGQLFVGSNMAIGGTSILILVSVSLQTLRAVESRALMVTYDQYSEPDFFADASPESITNPKKRRFSLLPRGRRA